MRGLRHKDLLFLILPAILFAAGLFPAFSQADGPPFVSPSLQSPLLDRVQEIVHFTPLYAPVAVSSAHPRDLLKEAQDRRALHLSTTSSFFSGRLQSESTISYAGADGTSVDQARDARHQAVRLGLNGTDGRWHYGVAYRSGGEAAVTDADQTVRTAWVSWRSPTLAMTSSIQQQSNTVSNDSSRPHPSALQKRLAMDLTLPSWPTLTVAYTQGLSSGSMLPVGAPARHQTDAIETSLNYELFRVKVHAASTYETADDLVRPGANGLRVQHLVSSSYSPLASLTLGSTLSLTNERREWSSNRSETPSAEVTMAYHAPQDVDVSLLSSYSRTQDSLGTVDLRSFNAKSLLSWRATHVGFSATTFSLETGYSNTADLNQSANQAARSLDNLSAIFHVTLTGKSWSDFIGQ